MIKTKINSWGKTKEVICSWCQLNFSSDNFKIVPCSLPVGLLRSYGDSSLPLENQVAYSTLAMNRIISFDRELGIFEAEAGISFDEILQIIVPSGWFLPVTPGTKFITLGGAIANDIHGKNHHQDGTFGHFISELTLLTSTGEKFICHKNQNAELFYATIGGLGLTGIILSAKFNLKKIQSSQIEGETIKFSSLKEFIQLNHESKDYLYTVAWLDCLSKSPRGIYIRGNHSTSSQSLTAHRTKNKIAIPFNFPNFALNNFTIKIFNFLYFHKQIVKRKKFESHYDPFFYPLDSILKWNHIYGKRGFYQYQCVLPMDKISEFEKMLQLIAESGLGSFLSVLKTFGPIPSLGKISFPSEGFTIALDFANTGKNLEELFRKLNHIVIESKGRIYPAKDFNMNEAEFKTYYPQFNEFQKYKDQNLVSGFSKRVNL